MSARRYQRLAIALLVFFIGAGISTEAAACSCFRGYQSGNIVRATVMDIFEPSDNRGPSTSYFALLKIEHTFRGRLTGAVAIYISSREGSACGIDLQKGATLNIGLDRDYTYSVYTADLCSIAFLKQ